MDGLNDVMNRWLLYHWPWGIPMLTGGIALVVAGLTALYSESPGAGALLTFVWLWGFLTFILTPIVRRLRRARGEDDTTEDLVLVAAYVDRRRGPLPADLRDTAVRYAHAQLKVISPPRLAVQTGVIGVVILAVAIAMAASVVTVIVTTVVLTGLTYGVLTMLVLPRRNRTLQVLEALGA